MRNKISKKIEMNNTENIENKMITGKIKENKKWRRLRLIHKPKCL